MFKAVRCSPYYENEACETPICWEWGALAMEIVYYCKYCKAFMGVIDGSRVPVEALGFSILTAEEQADMIQYDGAQDTTYVRTVCEHCEIALRSHPDLLLSQTPIQ